MLKYHISILIVLLIELIILGQSIELTLPVISLFLLLAYFSTVISIELNSMKKDLVKLKKYDPSKKTKEKKNSIENESKYYYSEYGGNTVRKFVCKYGKFQRFGQPFKLTELNEEVNVVQPFNSLDDVKHHCMLSLTREDGVAFTTTDRQLIFPNGFIVTLTKLTESVYTVIDISDFNEIVPYKSLKKLGSDVTGRFYVKNDSELLLILKVIYSIRGGVL